MPSGRPSPGANRSHSRGFESAPVSRFEVEGIDAASHRVVEVHRATVARPGRTVGDGVAHVVPHTASVGGVAIQRAGARLARIVHRAAPEAAARVALAIVEAIARRLGLGPVQVARRVACRVGIEEGVAAPQRHDQARAVGALGDGRDFFVEAPARTPVIGRAIAVQPALEDIDPPQRLGARRPACALAEGRAGFPEAAGRAGHGRHRQRSRFDAHVRGPVAVIVPAVVVGDQTKAKEAKTPSEHAPIDVDATLT